ncbi:hypothetical protein ACLBR5_21860 [Escherichia coli]
MKSAITYKLSPDKITSPSSRSLVAKSVSWSTPLSWRSNQHGLAHLEKASARGQYSLLLLGMVHFAQCLIDPGAWFIAQSRVHLPNKRRRCNGCWTVILTPLSRGNRWRTGAGYHRAADGCVSQQCSCTESPPRTAGGAGQSAYS